MTSRPPLTLVPPPDTAPPGDTVTRLDIGAAERPARTRYVGPDVVRALALIGVAVMNYHGYLILLGGRNDHSTMWGRFFDPWTGPLSTRGIRRPCDWRAGRITVGSSSWRWNITTARLRLVC